MRTTSLLALFFITISNALFCQSPVDGLIFRISAIECQQLLEKEKVEGLDFLLNRSPVDTLRPDTDFNKLSYGHYITVQAKKELLSWKLFSHNQHRLHLHEDRKQLNVSVVNEHGIAIEKGSMHFEKKKMRFEQTSRSFSSRRTKDGLLIAYLPSDTLFYEINGLEEKNIITRRLQYFAGSKFGYIITSPFRWIKGGVQYIKRGVKNNHWRIYRWPFRKLYHRIVHPESKPIKGYIASNQPVYRIGDTLKLSAFVATEKGRALKKPLTLRIKGPKIGFIDSLITPTTPGRYTMNWVLGDSLQLDAHYSVRLINSKRRHSSSLFYRFKIEDYQLDEYRFELLSKNPSFKAHEPVELKLKASDTNGLAIPATTVDGHLFVTTIKDLYTDSLLIPDTLWQFQEEMGNRTDLSLIPPDSLFSNAQLNLNVDLQFQGPSGEGSKKSTGFVVDRPVWTPLLIIKGDSLYGFINGEPRNNFQSGQLFSYSGKSILQKEEIVSNFSCKINPYAEYYEWTIGGKKAKLMLRTEQNLVNFDFVWVNDTLTLHWSNPRALTVVWSLKSSNGNIEDGTSNDKIISVHLPKNQNTRQLWLHYSYPWNGIHHQVQKDIKALNDQLQINLQVPEKIYPGQTENITLTVKDAKGKPVSDVALTAAAYNAQFRQKSPFETSNIRFKRRRKPFVRQRYTTQLPNISNSVPLHKDWYEKLSLDTQLYYRLRFPAKEGLYEYCVLESKDSLAQKTAQISPWIVQNGQLVSIHLIYLDNRLVYYHNAWQSTPYSLVTEPGYHQLTMRTAHGEVRMDSVLLKAGHRLDLSIDLSHNNPNHFLYFPKENELSRQEISLLEKRLFYMQPLQKDVQPQFLYQDPKHIFQLFYKQNQTFAWGLLEHGKYAHWLKPGIDTIQFPFDPYFSYRVSHKRDRLYEHRPLSKSKKVVLPNHLTQPNTGREALFLADINEPEWLWFYHYDKFPTEAAQNRGRIQLFLGEFAHQSEALVLSKTSNDTILYVLHPRQSPIVLPEGEYAFSWVMKDSTILEKKINIIAHHLLALKIEKEDLVRKPISTGAAKSIKDKKRRSMPPNGRLYSYTPKSNPNFNNGRLISGFVTDPNGEVLIGASILLNGTKIGTITDIDGYYELWVPHGTQEISISYTGYQATKLDIESKNDGSVALGEGLVLESVVITAYGVPRVSQDNTVSIGIRGARTKVTQQYIDGLPTRDIGALMGKTAGISVVDGDSSGNNFEKIDFSLDDIVLPLDSIRDSFRDYAYWQPALTSDKSGQVTFPVTFPDDITSWNHFALGMDGKARIGLANNFTSAYLPLQAQLYTPRFLIEGDRATVNGVLTNRSGQALEINSYLQASNGQREERTSILELSNKEVFELEPVPTGIDSLEYTYGLIAGEYKDGEMRQIPIFPIGSKRTIGSYMVLNQDSIYEVNVNPIYGAVDLRVGGNGLPQLMREIQWLRNYHYGCNEQTASRLIALLAIKKLQAPNEPDTELEKDILAMIQRLEKNRATDGAWGWWKSSVISSRWITQHVLTALQKAKELGYRVPDVNLAERYLLGSLAEQNKGERLETLLFFAERGQILEYENYLQDYDTLSRPLKWEMKYRRIQQLQGLPYQLDSLSKYAQRTLTGARYWGTPQHWYFRPSRQTVNMTLQAYQLYRDAGMLDSVLAIQQYFMEDDPFHPKGAQKDHWGLNTYEASKITEALLPDLLGEDNTLQKLNIVVKQTNEKPISLDTFPKQLQLLPTPNFPIEIDKSGDGPAFVSYHQSYWDTDPPAESNGFKVETKFIQNGRKADKFEVGKSVQMVVTVDLEAGADYVLVEIPVPAGCSYGKKIFREHRRETHREYQRDRVAIFLEQMPTGQYEFTINLDPRFAGSYTVNPARAEMMYIPSFNGSTKLKVVEIK